MAAYPWSSPGERERAREETELVAFGESVEVDDLPLRVRRWLRSGSGGGPFAGWTWRGEKWGDLIAGLEKAVLSQALAAHRWRVAPAARALGATQRVVAYKARKHGLIQESSEKRKGKKRKD